MPKKSKPKSPKKVETLTHEEASRKNIPTAEFQSMLAKDDQRPIEARYPRGVSGLEKEKEHRNRDLDPQIVWRGKDERDWSDLVVPAPPLFIQEKVHPKVLIDDLMRRSAAAAAERAAAATDFQVDLFADFNGLASPEQKTEFYQHDANWSNRMILGDSLQVMASLAEREGLRGQVQCIYIDPPYGIKFNSNFQWSTTSRDVKDGNADHITREPEQVKAFRDTWRDGIHSYLTYLRDRLTVGRDLLTDSGSIFVQIGDENVHRVRAVMDEILGEGNIVGQIPFKKSGSQSSELIPSNFDYVLWYAKHKEVVKFRPLLLSKAETGGLKGQDVWAEDESGFCRRLGADEEASEGTRTFTHRQVSSPGASQQGEPAFDFEGTALFPPAGRHWSVTVASLKRLQKTSRLFRIGKSLRAKDYFNDRSVSPLGNVWADTSRSGFGEPLRYVVETSIKVVQRCLLMTTDPGDLVLDPTCGSGTTATVAEQWGRRWITIDTSPERVNESETDSFRI
jgi:adenine-specific DNA-methyltransferase